MQNILSKDTIEIEILPYLPKARRGYTSRVELWRIVQAILYKLKTGCQWRQLPLKEFLESHPYTWISVYHHFRRWSQKNIIQNLWQRILTKYKRLLDLSSANLDGSHTIAKRGGESVGYQRRKRAETTNMLFLSDSRGQFLACSQPISGQHNDLWHIHEHFQQICTTLRQSRIAVEGLFINADAGFDCQQFRHLCAASDIQLNYLPNFRNSKFMNDTEALYPAVDPLLYSNRFVIERSNAWLDAFKNLLMRFDRKAYHWLQWHYLAFIVLLLRKIHN